MAEYVSIHVNLAPPSIDTQYLTPALILDWLSTFQWWQWLLILKFGFILWVFNVTVILPSLYMQVMLYTDEMTSSRQQSHLAADTLLVLREVNHLITWAVASYSAIQKEMEFKDNWLDKTERHFKRLQKKRRKKTFGKDNTADLINRLHV
ncbi:uncharacterized protein [Panulirus ornatus]|uniref:uncharacterized protein n=1 Tax=Panulirus ornatus TaxID=150431 RepID=UPI003A88AD16